MYNYTELKKIHVPSPSKSESKRLKGRARRWIKSLENEYPFIKSLVKAFNKTTASRHKLNLSESNEAIFILFSVAIMTFWILVLIFCIGALIFDAPLDFDFDPNTSEHYNEWIQIEGIDVQSVDKDLVKVFKIGKKLTNNTDDFDEDLFHEFATKVIQIVDNHCLNELHFELKEEIADSITSQFETLIWHYVMNETVVLTQTEKHNEFVITKNGQILNKDDIIQMGEKQENIDYGYCSLITELYKMFAEKHLLAFENANASKSDSELDHRSNHEIWENDYKHLFLMNNTNQDSYKFIHEIVSIMGDHKMNQGRKHRHIHVLSYVLLNNYCSEIFDHLHGFENHETLIQSVSNYAAEMTHIQIHTEVDDIPVIDKNGYLTMIPKEIHLKNEKSEYETCPFIKNIVFYHFGSINQQIDNVIGALNNHSISVFDIKMEMLLQQYCYNMMDILNGDIYHFQFKQNLYRFVTDLVDDNKNQKVSKYHNIYVNSMNGDITNKCVNNKCASCLLLSEMVKLRGHDVSPNDNDFMYHFEEDNADLGKHHNYASVIYELAKNNDFANLQSEIRNLLVEIYNDDITKHFQQNSKEYFNHLEILISEIEQYIIELLAENKIIKEEMSVMMDILAGIVVDIKRNRINTLKHNWVQLSVLDEIIDLHRNDLQTRNAIIQQMIHPQKSDIVPELKPQPKIAVNDMNKLDHFVNTLWNDVKLHDQDQDKIVNEFNEDVVYGLNEFCGPMMTQISSSFVKRKLRMNVLSLILIKKREIKDPIITNEGDIVSFHDYETSEQAEIFKCKFVQALMNKISQSV